MNIKMIIYTVLSVFITIGCASQNNNSKSDYRGNFNLTKDFEVFDSVRYSRLNNGKSSFSTEYLNDSTYIVMSYAKLQKSYSEPPPNSYSKLIKIYYSNGNIKEKGVAFINFFESGVWYEFDEKGKLIKEKDYDQYFKFTFEDVLKFCEKEGIRIKKSLEVVPRNSTTIRREISEGKSWWKIEWRKEMFLIESIKLDGNTGEIIEKTYWEDVS